MITVTIGLIFAVMVFLAMLYIGHDVVTGGLPRLLVYLASPIVGLIVMLIVMQLLKMVAGSVGGVQNDIGSIWDALVASGASAPAK